MFDFNNPDDVIQEEEVTTPEPEANAQPEPEANAQPEPEVIAQPEQDTNKGTEPEISITEEGTNFDWSDKESLENYGKEHPEFAPHIEKLLGFYKGMQSSYTKAMQNVPKHLRNANLTDLENRAKQWDGYVKSGKSGQPVTTPPPAQTEVKPPEIKEELLQRAIQNLEAQNGGEPLSQEEKNTLKSTLEMLEGVIDYKNKPIVEQLSRGEEERVKANLAKDENLQYFDLDSFWPDVQALKKDNPKLSYEDCLFLAIQKTKEFVDTETNKTYTSPGEYLRAMKAKDATPPPVGKARFVVGGNKAGGKKTPTYSQAEIDRMTPEEYEEKVLTSEQKGEK